MVLLYGVCNLGNEANFGGKNLVHGAASAGKPGAFNIFSLHIFFCLCLKIIFFAVLHHQRSNVHGHVVEDSFGEVMSSARNIVLVSP